MIPEQQFKSIYNYNYPKVIGLCLGYVSGNAELAKDLAQEVFIKVWENLKNFRNESTVSTWIYRITVNTCLQELRKKKYLTINMEIKDETFLDQLTYHDHIANEVRYETMHKCINSLSVVNRSIILLELEDIPQIEIAEIMGISHQAVRTRINRIKVQLSKCVKNE